MGALLESGMVGNIGLKHLRVIKEDTIPDSNNAPILYVFVFLFNLLFYLSH